jgi:hypothetical protein
LDTDSIQPPVGGRAPGWDAGLVVARRHEDRGELAVARSKLSEPRTSPHLAS